MLIDIEPGLKITRYGYRKKKAINRILSIDYGTGDQIIRTPGLSPRSNWMQTIAKPSFSNMRTGVRLFSSFLIRLCYIGTDIADF